MSKTVKQLAGRRIRNTSAGVTSLSVPYEVILDGNDAPLAANGEAALVNSLITAGALPRLQSSHSGQSSLVLTSYSVEERSGSDKSVLMVTANYERTQFSSYSEGGEGGATPATTAYAVEEWGWDEGVDERELVTDVAGTPVVNSAGDVFESVPSVSVLAPTFTKVMKFAAMQSGALAYNCKINDAAVTIGGQSYPARSLLCTVGVNRVIGDETWKWRYTVHLKYRTNLVDIDGNGTVTDIGWDVALTDAGMRELDDNNQLKRIKCIDEETGREGPVSSPELLNGQGKAQVRSSTGGGNPVPVNLRFRVYETATFPTWFYSDPDSN